jgi:uncharacterized membrane protein
MKALLALVCLVVTGVTFYMYTSSANTLYFVVAVVFLILTLIFGGMFLAGRVNKTDDIHITE